MIKDYNILCNNENELKFAEKYLFGKGYKYEYEYKRRINIYEYASNNYPVILYSDRVIYIYIMIEGKFNGLNLSVKKLYKITYAKQLMREEKFKRLYDIKK